MDVVILAGGYGTRFKEETEVKPKPMIEIGSIPLLIHLIKFYKQFNHNNFLIAGGYKVNVIKDYFNNMLIYQNDITFNFHKNSSSYTLLTNDTLDSKISIHDTGLGTLTSERILKLKEHIQDDIFMCTYGDGLSNLNLDELLSSHLKSKKIATLTVSKPKGRFGEIKKNAGIVTNFNEKPISNIWVNSGFFVFNKDIFKYLEINQMLEDRPIKKLIQDKELNAYEHEGFWQPMDTYRDWLVLEELWNSGNAPWKIW